jgi:hypothetical protein
LKTIKMAKALGTALADLDAAAKADNVILPEKTGMALEKLRKAVDATASLLLDLGQAEFNRTVEEAKAKLKPSQEPVQLNRQGVFVTPNSTQG